MNTTSTPEKLKEQVQNLTILNEKNNRKIETLKSNLKEHKKTERTLREEKEFSEYLFHTLRGGCLVLDSEFRVKMANTAFYKLFQVTADETEGKLLYELGNNQWNIPHLRDLFEKVLPEKKVVNDYEIEHDFERIGNRIMLLNARQIDHLQLFLLIIEDTTDRKRAIKEVNTVKDSLEYRVEEQTRQVRELAKRLTGSEQRERRRIASILHDDLQQLLFAIQMNLKLVNRKIENDEFAGQLSKEISDQISEVIKLANRSIEKTRQLTGDLNPAVLKSPELSKMLDWLSRRFKELHGLQTDLKENAHFNVHDEELRAVLMQILRELLFNIVKHADTDKAIIETNGSEEDEMRLSIIDYGKGFDPESIKDKESFGLFNIKERLKLFGGNLDVDSAPGEGCRMMIHMPAEKLAIQVSG